MEKCVSIPTEFRAWSIDLDIPVHLLVLIHCYLHNKLSNVQKSARHIHLMSLGRNCVWLDYSHVIAVC